MNFKESLSQLNKHNLIAIVGNEQFYRDQIKNRIIKDNKDCDVVKIDCDEMDEKDIFISLQFKDLFCSKRVFILRNFTKIKKLEYFTENKITDIVLFDSDKAGKSKAFDEFKKKILYVECNKPKPWEEESDATGKILGFFKLNNLTISENVALYLYNQIGYNLYKLMYEMQKLLIYKESSVDKQVTEKNIDTICVSGLKYSVFDLIDKIIDNNKKDALCLLEKINKYETNSGILLISLWYNHFENLLYLKHTDREDEISENIKLPPMVIKKKLMPQSNKISDKKIIESLDYLMKIDYNLRKGSFDLNFYLEKFIINF